MAEKNQKATPKQIEDARKKGQVAQSQDLPKLMILWAVAEAVLALADSSMQRLENLMAMPLTQFDQPFARIAEELTSQALWLAASFSMICVGLAIVMRLLGSWMQFGFLFAPESLKPKMEKFNPFTNLKQMFTMRSLVNTLGSVLKAMVIAVAMYYIVKPSLGTLVSLVQSDLQTYWHALAELFQRILRVTCGILLALGLLDFGIQKYFHAKQLRMSHEDIKQEYKNSEGDPEMKGHRKQLAHEILNAPPKKPQKPVKDADVLVVNPTHYAVGLYYKPGETPLPRIHCKGMDDQALDLIAEAKRAGVPVIQCIWLARTLYRTDEGRYIPRDTLTAVAQIFGVVRQLDQQVPTETIEANYIDPRA